MKLTKSEIILIENVLNNPKKFTRNSFAEYLESKELPFSTPTITRILKNIEDEIGLKLKFSRNGFCVIIEDETELDYLQKYQNYKGLYFRHILQKSNVENSIQSQFISFSFDTVNKNIEFIEPILNSIIESKKIKIFYQKFQENDLTEYLVNPTFIKEYLNRWYIIGTTEKIKNQVFALDRISTIEFLDQKFLKEKSNDLDVFKNTIGINFSAPIEIIILWISEEQYPYFETLPLHKSQKTLEETEDGFIISLEVSINYELERWILYYGSDMKVIEPQTLKDKIKTLLLENIKNY